MGQPLDPLNGRLVAYDQLLDLKRQSVDRFCLRFFGCEMGKKAGLAATLLGFWGLNPQNWWSETYLDQGKKKAKLTGTPDVVRFKGTREFCLLQARLKCDETSWHENERLGLKSRCQAALRQECKEIQESLPFVHEDPLDDFAYKKVG